MKLLQVLLIALAVYGAMAKFSPIVGDNAKTATPQWTCDKVTLENKRAREANADNTKCQYLEYIRQVFIEQYKTPSYPSCYAQMDLKCTDKIANYYEKKNIKKFSIALEAYCSKGAQWDDFKTLLGVFQNKFADAFNTDYWTCIDGELDQFIADQYVTFPSWPTPYLDVLNYVCQDTEAKLRNAERIQFQDFFDAHDGYMTNLPGMGRALFQAVANQIASADLADEIKSCFVAEIGYFHNAMYPEVEIAYNTKESAGDNVADVEVYPWDGEDGELFSGAPYNAEKGGYECWNYYAPDKHYHEKDAKVTETAFDGNRGHPLCPPNTMYQPISEYGPICCPIHPVDEKPYTYNCCYQSVDLPQQTKRRVRRGRRYRWVQSKMADDKECFGCTCLKGSEMVLTGSYWMGDWENGRGACFEKFYDDGEE